MKKSYTVVLTVLQLFVGVLGLVYLVRGLLGAQITMSLFIAIPLTIFSLLLGIENIIQLSKPDASACEKLRKGWENEWRKKVVQLQVPIFAPNTRAAWGLRFDDVLADALELGPLRSPDISFPPDLEQRIEKATPKGVPTEVLRTLVGYYIANRQEDTDWVVLPVINFDAYFGNNFSHRWLNALPEDVIVRQRDGGRGVCRYMVNGMD